MAKQAKKSTDIIKSISDDLGNLIVCRNNGKRVILSLKLVVETRYRKVGVINIARKTIEIKRKRALHLFRKSNAYGFNTKLLQDSKLFDKVRLSDEHGEWLIPKEFILTHGKYLNFINSGGFELQSFISLDQIEEFKRNPKI